MISIGAETDAQRAKQLLRGARPAFIGKLVRKAGRAVIYR
jgi:hypothetical protein